MKNALPIQRERSVGLKGIIEYTYANYDVELAQNDYDAISETLAKAQTALDYVNKIQEEVVNADGTTSLVDRRTLSSGTETQGYGTQYVFRYNAKNYTAWNSNSGLNT